MINEELENQVRIYLMFNESFPCFYKIGMSHSPENRVKSITRRGNSKKPDYFQGCKVYLMSRSKPMPRIEAKQYEWGLHNQYRHKRYCGEWFLLDTEEIKQVIRQINDVSLIEPCTDDWILRANAILATELYILTQNILGYEIKRKPRQKKQLKKSFVRPNDTTLPY